MLFLQCRESTSSNALPILLATIRKTVSAEDPDILSLVEAALMAHAQLTSDVCAAIPSDLLARRQVWLAQTSLPENVSKDLSKERSPLFLAVFHPDTQAILDEAE